MLVDVHRQNEGVVPSGEGVLGVASVVEDALLILVVAEVCPAAGGEAGDLPIGFPLFNGAVGFLDQGFDVAADFAFSTNGVEVNVVVNESAVSEGVVDLEGSGDTVDLVALSRVGVQFSEGLSDLVGLVCVALPEGEVGLVGCCADAATVGFQSLGDICFGGYCNELRFHAFCSLTLDERDGESGGGHLHSRRTGGDQQTSACELHFHRCPTF